MPPRPRSHRSRQNGRKCSFGATGATPLPVRELELDATIAGGVGSGDGLELAVACSHQAFAGNALVVEKLHHGDGASTPFHRRDHVRIEAGWAITSVRPKSSPLNRSGACMTAATA